MTSGDRNDLVPAQEKLEWVTPKISLDALMNAAGTDEWFTPKISVREAGETRSKFNVNNEGVYGGTPGGPCSPCGPS